jgi:hypothetical protein
VANLVTRKKILRSLVASERFLDRSSRHFPSVLKFKLDGKAPKLRRICLIDGRRHRRSCEHALPLTALLTFLTTSSVAMPIWILLIRARLESTTQFSCFQLTVPNSTRARSLIVGSTFGSSSISLLTNVTRFGIFYREALFQVQIILMTSILSSSQA